MYGDPDHEKVSVCVCVCVCVRKRQRVCVCVVYVSMRMFGRDYQTQAPSRCHLQLPVTQLVKAPVSGCCLAHTLTDRSCTGLSQVLTGLSLVLPGPDWYASGLSAPPCFRSGVSVVSLVPLGSPWSLCVLSGVSPVSLWSLSGPSWASLVSLTSGLGDTLTSHG